MTIYLDLMYINVVVVLCLYSIHYITSSTPALRMKLILCQHVEELCGIARKIANENIDFPIFIHISWQTDGCCVIETEKNYVKIGLISKQ